MASTTVSMESVIAEELTTVEACFSALISQPQSTPLFMQANTVQDSHDRFYLWVSNLGPLNSSLSRHSLIYRLSSAAPELLEDIKDLLRELSHALIDVLEITDSNQEGSSLTKPGPKDFLLDELGDGADSTEEQVITLLLEIADECISGLLRLVALVRKPTSGQDQFSEAQHHADPFSDHFDIIYVQERYPKLCRPESRWLSERFGRANAKRRQFLRHAREHRDRLRNQKAEGPRTSAPDSTGAATSQPLQSPFEPDSKKPMDEDTGSRLILNLMNVNNNGEPESECPLCWAIRDIGSRRAWRLHVFADLKPYVCSLEEGECDDLLFGDPFSWFDHELQCHRRQWVCIMCEGGPFEAAEKFDNHLKSAHSDLPPDMAGLEVVKDASQRAVSEISAADCPFCDEWEDILRQKAPGKENHDPSAQPGASITVSPRTFQAHVAHHMEQLALFALPRGLVNSGDEDERNLTAIAGKEIED